MTDGPLRVAHFYGGPREGAEHSNPYGDLLASALERLGVEVSFELGLDENYLRAAAGRVDVLHLHWPQSLYFHELQPEMEGRMRRLVGDLGLARRLGFRLVWTAHNLYPHNALHRGLDREFRLELCQRASAIIAHCELAAEAVRQELRPGCRVFVIPHGHFRGVLPVRPSRQAARRAFGIGGDSFTYAFFGNMQPYKGLEGLIDAFMSIPDDRSRLILCGGGRSDYQASLAARASSDPRIVFELFDFAPGSAFARVLQAADVIVLPFVESMTSGSLVLGLSWGRPAIVPAMGCLPNQMDAAAGILYDPGTPDGLHAALLEIRTRDQAPARRAALASVARFDWDEIARRTIEAYRA